MFLRNRQVVLPYDLPVGGKDDQSSLTISIFIFSASLHSVMKIVI